MVFLAKGWQILPYLAVAPNPRGVLWLRRKTIKMWHRLVRDKQILPKNWIQHRHSTATQKHCEIAQKDMLIMEWFIIGAAECPDTTTPHSAQCQVVHCTLIAKGCRSLQTHSSRQPDRSSTEQEADWDPRVCKRDQDIDFRKEVLCTRGSGDVSCISS